MKKVVTFLFVLALGITTMFTALPQMTKGASAAGEVRGLWVAFCDFQSLGLANKSRSTYTRNVGKLLDKAKYYGTNTIYFHARAFDDATWKSKTFKACSYLTGKASGSRTAYKTYSYDPLAIVIKECRKRNLKIEAWLNPYRVTYGTFLNPASAYSTLRIERAVKELQSYDLDGIHFDDYFYHSQKYYLSPYKSYRYSVSPSGSRTKSRFSAANRRSNVNSMVKKVYTRVHQNSGWKFGISPAGNYENCMNDGVDVRTWLSKRGYADYITPQIYWSDNWGSRRKTRMFTNRLNQFKKLNKAGVSMTIGLALYDTGKKISGDKGWKMRNTNLRTQIRQLRSKGMQGYSLFSAQDLYRKGAANELYYMKGLVKPIYAKSISITSKNTIYVGRSKTLTVSFKPSTTNPKDLSYKTANKSVATISGKGVVKGYRTGYVVVTAQTKNKKKATRTLRVKPSRVKIVKYITQRKGPGSKYNVAGIYRKGQKVYIERINGKWGKLKGKSTWIYMPATKWAN